MNSPRLSRAFTLIEILVVVSIIGIVLSIAVLSLGVLGDDRELREEARRLAALVQVAQDEAVMQGRDFGIEFMSNGFRFVEYDPFLNAWGELIGDDTLRMRSLPEEAEFDLWIEGQRVLLDAQPAAFDDPEDEEQQLQVENYAPHILVFSSGDMTPFELHLLRSDLGQAIVLESNLLGDIKFVDPEDL
ncbi:MAG: type II secretion system minor pseudopilin GspH [Woeseiaceae bacterium]|nr:type II secretion system minor pseudopilin GspH [Woeseiaceae bacterium]